MHPLQFFCKQIFYHTISILKEAKKKSDFNVLTNTEILFSIELETLFV